METKRILLHLVKIMSAIALNMQNRILGGTRTLIEDIPYQVSLQNMKTHFCGGSIISDEWVLTAAHCIHFPYQNYTIFAGSNDLNQGGNHFDIDFVIINDEYNEHTVQADLALIKLMRPFNFSRAVQPVELFDQDEILQLNQIATVSGWGDGNDPPDLLHKVDLFIVSKEQCANSYNLTELLPGQICAGSIDGGKDSCGGDSGGPLIVKGRLAGIVSWGVECGYSNDPGVYTEVAQFRNWIDRITKKKNYENFLSYLSKIYHFIKD